VPGKRADWRGDAVTQVSHYRETIMMRGRFSVAVVFLIVGLSAASARAQDVVIRGTNFHHNLRWQSVDVGDVKGHSLGVYDNKGVSLYGTGERVDLAVRGTANFINGIGPVHGYDIRKFADGSTLTLEFTGEITTISAEGSFGEGKYLSCRGTGRFENVKCEGTWKGGRQGDSLQVVEWEVKLMR
jgi:hypothetical protein